MLNSRFGEMFEGLRRNFNQARCNENEKNTIKVTKFSFQPQRLRIKIVGQSRFHFRVWNFTHHRAMFECSFFFCFFDIIVEKK